MRLINDDEVAVSEQLRVGGSHPQMSDSRDHQALIRAWDALPNDGVSVARRSIG